MSNAPYSLISEMYPLLEEAMFDQKIYLNNHIGQQWNFTVFAYPKSSRTLELK